MIRLDKPWTRQPQSRLLLDSRFAASALGVWVPGLGELTGKRAPSNADINSFSELGRVYRQTGGSLDRRVFDSSDAWIPTTQFTILVVYRYGTALGTGEGVGNGYFSNVNGRATLYFGTSGSIFFDFGGATNGTTRVTGSFSYAAGKVAQIVATVGPAGMRLYVNGQLLGSNTATPTRTVATNYGFVAGDCYGGTSGNGAQQSIVAAFGSQLPDEVARSLSANPWQLFAPRQIWIPASVAASGLPTLSLSTYKPGTLTSSGWTPRVTAS